MIIRCGLASEGMRWCGSLQRMEKGCEALAYSDDAWHGETDAGNRQGKG